MAIAASNNIEPATNIAAAHNDRSIVPNYLLGDSSKNICTRSAVEVHHLIERLNKIGKKIYEKSVKQKFQKNTKLVVESVINFNESHTLEDIKNVASYMEKEYGFTILQIAMHNDEGVFIKNKGFRNEQVLAPGKDIFYIDGKWKDINNDYIDDPRENGWEIELNRHAHVLMHNLRRHERTVKRTHKDSKEYQEIYKKGTTIYQKMSVTELRNLQTETAIIMKMPRGVPGARRKKTKDFKDEKRNISKAKEQLHKDYDKKIITESYDHASDLQMQKYMLNKQINESTQSLFYHNSILNSDNTPSLNIETFQDKDSNLKNENQIAIEELQIQIKLLNHQLRDSINANVQLKEEIEGLKSSLMSSEQKVKDHIRKNTQLGDLIIKDKNEFTEIINGLKKENLKLDNQIKSTKNYMLEINNFIMQIAPEFNISVTDSIFNNISILPKLLDTVKTQKNKASEEYANLEKEVRLLQEDLDDETIEGFSYDVIKQFILELDFQKDETKDVKSLIKAAEVKFSTNLPNVLDNLDKRDEPDYKIFRNK